MSLHQLLTRPIAFHRVLAEIAGSVGGGVFLSQALYWTERTTLPDGWFYKTAAEWFDETYMGRREQETVRKRLVALKLLQEELRGVPAKLHYRLNLAVLNEHLQNLTETQEHSQIRTNGHSSMAENAKLDWRKAPNKDGGKRQSNTETTAETTSETKSILVDAQFAEFWAVFPKRGIHANPKHPAKISYIKAVTQLKVPHETLMQAAREYAASVADRDPQMVAQARTWLNQRRWEAEEAPAAPVQAVDTAELERAYPGRVGDRKALAAALKACDGTMPELLEAAEKFALLIKLYAGEGRDMAAPLLETWIKFRWREMQDYEFCYRGMTNRKSVRPKKARAA